LRFLIISFILLHTSYLNAQVYERYLEEEVEITYPRKLEVEWANDVFFQTDRYFTNGLVLEYYSQGLGRFGVANLLFDSMSESGPVYSLTLTHDIFTPNNVFGNPELCDRPYAGVLMLGLKATHFSKTKQYRFYSEIQAGLLGEYAGGRFVQNGIHVLLPASEPIPGWAYQIDPDLCLQYNISLEKLAFKSRWLNVDMLAKGRLGLPYTDFSGGGRLRIGISPDYYSPDHLLSKNNNYLYLIAGFNLRTVFYDATLQGGAINDKNPHTIINTNPLIGEFKAGIAARFANYTLEMGAQKFTAMFQGALAHQWAYFKLGILF